MRCKEKETVQEQKMVYCNLMKCPHRECERHTVNTPWNTMVLMKSFNPDKEWNCKDLLLEDKNK